jgi:hypothetical protein
MTAPTVACTNCGNNFTTEDLRGTNCRYCGTLLAHRARAQQQAVLVQEMLADRNGNGIPDAYEGLVANAQANAMQQAFGAPPPYSPYAPPPYGGAPIYGQPVMQIQQQTARAMSRVFLIVGISIVLITVLTFVLIGVVFFLSSRSF